MLRSTGLMNICTYACSNVYRFGTSRSPFFNLNRFRLKAITPEKESVPQHRRKEHFRGDRNVSWKRLNQIGGKVCCFGGKTTREVSSESMLLSVGFSSLSGFDLCTVVGPLRQKNYHSHSSSTKSHFHLSDGLGSYKGSQRHFPLGRHGPLKTVWKDMD